MELISLLSVSTHTYAKEKSVCLDRDRNFTF